MDSLTFIPPEPNILSDFDTWFTWALVRHKRMYGVPPFASVCRGYSSARADYEHMVEVMICRGADFRGVALSDSVPVKEVKRG